METITITLILSILASVISVLNLIFSRKDKSNKDTGQENYKWGQFDTKLDNIEKTLAKIENKLDAYDKEIDSKIEQAFRHHIKEYHKGE